jgi:hypothetical protein
MNAVAGAATPIGVLTIYRRTIRWMPICRESPGRPPIAGGGELNVPVM